MEKCPLCPKNDENTVKVIVDAKKEAKRDANHRFLLQCKEVYLHKCYCYKSQGNRMQRAYKYLLV